MKTSLIFVLVSVASPVFADDDAPLTSPLTSLSQKFDAVLRGQNPPYDENPPITSQQTPNTSTYIVPSDQMIPMQQIPPEYNPFDTRVPGMSPYVPQGNFRFGANGPQPYKINRWVSRYDVGYLPSVSTENGLGDFGVFEVDADWEFATPGWWGLIFSFTQEFSMRNWDGPTGSPAQPTTAVPGNVFRFGMDFELATEASSVFPWSALIAFNPSLNSDFDSGLDSEAWHWDYRGILFYRASPVWLWAFGAGYWDRVNNKVVPYAGFVFTPNNRWEWRIVFPDPRVSYYMGNPWGFDTWFYARGQYNVESYQIQLQTTGRREEIEFEDWRLLMGFRNDNGYVGKFIEAGWVFGRNVDYLNGTPGFDITSGFILRGGLRY